MADTFDGITKEQGQHRSSALSNYLKLTPLPQPLIPDILTSATIRMASLSNYVFEKVC